MGGRRSELDIAEELDLRMWKHPQWPRTRRCEWRLHL